MPAIPEPERQVFRVISDGGELLGEYPTEAGAKSARGSHIRFVQRHMKPPVPGNPDNREWANRENEKQWFVERAGIILTPWVRVG